MDKFFQYLYYTVLTLFVGSVIYLTTVLFLAPRQDAYDRGFIACTRKLVNNLSGCERGKVGCPLKFLWHDMKCNVGIIYDGAADWLKGKQKTPWANYLFEPQLTAPEDQELYQSNALNDMIDIEYQNQLFEQKNQELEAAKQRMMNADKDVLLFNPADATPTEVPLVPAADENTETDKGNIADEADISLTPAENPETSAAAAPQDKNLLQEIKKQTEEKLRKGN